MRPSPVPMATEKRPWLARRPEIALTVFGVFLSYACGGCLSNEYVIPKNELARLAQLPPEQRGQRVHVVQSLGNRRADAIDTSQPPPSPSYDQQGEYGPPPEGYAESGSGPNVGVGVVIVPSPPILVPPLPPGPGFVGGHGRTVPGHMGRAAPMPRRPRTSGNSGNLGGGKLGKGGGKDDMIALVVVAAVLATIGIVATEGARYDGDVAIYPWQSLYLKDGGGQVREIPLAQLTQADAATSEEAMVADDEGWGMMRLGRRPLNRKGFAYKMDVGIFRSSSASVDSDGTGLNLQLGYFPHHFVGLLGTWSFAAGTNSVDNSFYRNNLALEAQVFPLSLWRVHLGGFGHLGNQWAHEEGVGTSDGLALGGGGLLEIELTTRLALALRVDYTTAKVGPEGDRWQSGMLFSAGVAIY